MKSGFTLDPGEKVVRKIQHHWIDLASLAVVTTVMLLVGLAISYGYGRYRALMPVAIPDGAIVALSAAFMALAVLILLVGLWVYQQNYILLTDHHLIQVEQQGLFHRQVDQVSLGRIQDVSGARPGIVPTLLNFGTVIIQSAGEQRQFIFHRVPQPQELADYILEIHEQFLRDNPGGTE